MSSIIIEIEGLPYEIPLTGDLKLGEWHRISGYFLVKDGVLYMDDVRIIEIPTESLTTTLSIGE